MPNLKIDGNDVTVPTGKRLINAIIEEGKIDQLHACGGHAKCTTCRVMITAGEPTQITAAEKELLAMRGLTANKGLRLSCQIQCDADMDITIISRLAGSGRKDAGGKPADAIEPPP